MIPSGCIGLKSRRSKTTSHTQVAASSEVKDGGRYRIRTYDFHRVKMALYR
jgi:hypothetical protein